MPTAFEMKEMSMDSGSIWVTGDGRCVGPGDDTKVDK